MDGTLAREHKRLSFFRSPLRKMKDSYLGRKFNGLSLGREAKELVGYSPLAHLSGELDRIIIKSDNGAYNKLLIYRAALGDLTYDTIQGKVKPLDALPVKLLNTTKKEYIETLSNLVKTSIVFLTRNQNDHYVFETFLLKKTASEEVLVLIDENYFSNNDFSTLGILTPYRNITQDSFRVFYDFKAFKQLVNKFEKYRVQDDLLNANNRVRKRNAGIFAEYHKDYDDTFEGLVDYYKMQERQGRHRIVTDINNPVGKKVEHDVLSRARRVVKNAGRYIRNRVSIRGYKARSASVSKTLRN